MRYLLVPITALAIVMLLYFAANLFVPLLFAILFSQVLSPLVARLERWVPQPLAILIVMVFVGAILGAAGVLISEQMAGLTASADLFQKRLDDSLQAFQTWLTNIAHINPSRQVALLREWLNASLATGQHLALAAVKVTVSAVGELALIGILVFLMLLFRRHIRRELTALFEGENRALARVVFDRVSSVGQNYLAGLATVILIVGSLDALGMLIVGIPYAVLFGTLGGLSVSIPYVGIAIVAPLCTLFTYIALASLKKTVGVLVVFVVVHFLEGNVITPYVTGSKVDLNPLATLIAVLIGGELWGVSGMILFIPLVGVLKVVFDSFATTQPISGLLGRITPEQRMPPKPIKPRAQAVQKT